MIVHVIIYVRCALILNKIIPYGDNIKIFRPIIRADLKGVAPTLLVLIFRSPPATDVLSARWSIN